MDSYAPLLEKIRIPQPSLQKLAVISIFDKFRSIPPSNHGRDAVSLCLRSTSPAVVDQSTRELCRLVKDSKLDISTGLLELQSALEESSSPQFAGVFIKAIGLLTRLGFEEKPYSFRFNSSDNHPFVKILSCGIEVQGELVKQVIIFMTKCKHLGMEAVCDFLGPFLNYCIVKVPTSSSSFAFVRNLMSTMAAFCCSFPLEAVPIIKLFTRRFKYFPSNNAEEVTNVSYIFECLVDAYLVVLRLLVGMGSLVHEAQLCGLALLEAVLLQHRDFAKCSGGVEKILDVTRHLLAIQKELGLNYVTELSSLMLSLFPILVQSELEHEQYSILKLVLFLLRWKNEDEHGIGAFPSQLSEELLFIFPVLALVSSPSRFVKQTATDLLSILGKIAADLKIAPKGTRVTDGKHLSVTAPGSITFRFLRNLWFEDQLSLHGLVYVNLFSDGGVYGTEEHCQLKAWASSVREYYLGIIGKQKSRSTISQSEEIFLTEMPVILCAVASVFFLHQMGNSAIDLLAIGSNVEPKLGVPLLLMILFYNHILSTKEKDNDFHDMQLKLLGLLPSVASHPAMIPLALQILMPMLQKDVNPAVKATAIRLICKTWEINDRVFGSLQGMLHPSGIVQYDAERDICISIAVSIRDVCKRNPDRGVDIILSVAACIENHDPLVKSLGLQSLAHLCEADVIDFYTAWGVIAKHIQNYLGNAIVAYGLSLLLRWGAMDAEAYPEAATKVLNILWDIGTRGEVIQSSLWTRAREAAFTALRQYEVVHIKRSIPDFSTRNMEFLISEANPDLLTALEEFEIRIMNYEHITRRRFVKQKRVSASGSKIFKLLDVVPEVIFSSGSTRIKELPGAALLCLPTQKDIKNQGLSKGLQDVHAKYEDTVVEICASLQLSRNSLLALLSVQSWKPFMQRWLRSCTMVDEAKADRALLDKTSKAANDILKTLTRLAEAAVPRAAENVALALGAFCLVLPASSHTIKSVASNFLLNWLSQYEHEYRQWSAAISLGLISSCLHVTDHKQKFKNINGLLEVASISKSTLVRGACGIGLGFSCQDLLTRVDSGADTKFEKETYWMQETELLRKILRTLVQMIYQFTGSSSSILEKLAIYFPLGTDDCSSSEVEILREDSSYLEEDAWSVAGPIIGLGNSLGAIYRAGARDAVLYLKALIVSWIPTANILFSKSVAGETCFQMLSLGACLALPTITSFCIKVELIDDLELAHLVSIFMDLISGLLSVGPSDTFHCSLLMASCAASGSLLPIVFNAGLHSLEVNYVRGLLALFRRTYSSPNPPFTHLGGMLGVINVMGAGAGTLIGHLPLPAKASTVNQKELSHVLGPLLSNHDLEAEATSLIQDIFLVAQNSEDPQLQQYAAWAVSFLRHFVFSIGHRNEEDAVHNDSGVRKSVPQGFAEDSIVMKLCVWLVQMNYSELGTSINIKTTAFALRCLSHAPRLPSFDWEAVIRRCMKYSGQVAEMPSQSIAPRRGSLREDCLLFLLSHANQFDSLIGFLDELSDLARLKSLESNLQSLMLLHLADLLKIFSNSRVVKLFDDVADFLQWSVSSDQYNQEEKMSLRVSCWKGLRICLNDSALETQYYAYHLEHCMEVLFRMLPWSHSGVTLESYQKISKLEWTEAIGCLGKARQGWLSDLLLVSDTDFKKENDQIAKPLKKVQVKAALVRIGSIPLLELAKLKAYMLDTNSEVIWNILVEAAVTLQKSDESTRKQWLVDTAEILCVTSYPSTALRFLGLLSGSCCKYMPVLVADRNNVLTDLPATLSSLLLGPGWGVVADSVASYVWKSTERIHDWARHVKRGVYVPGSQPIDETENHMADFLLQVMHHTCVSLKQYLPVEKQLGLANMVVT
ncbi:protein RST1 [Sesamum indicum]|uniref:Protein RST1 n=1 Tax=Sesamum indicum TaxID=4182 RepID=A0A6I9UBS1_SESIN|nr:protein RST1 [Sesamum indicum]